MRRSHICWTACLVLSLLAPALASAQETQATPLPVVAPDHQTSAQPEVKPTPPTPVSSHAAPVERRNPHPNAASPEPVDGPLTPAPSASVQAERQPAGDGDPVTTIRVQTRLVNVAVNVVDAHDSPVSGFAKESFEVFEDGRLQTIAVFERQASTPLSIVLAIDASETVLTSERLEREAAKHFVKAILRPQDELELMEFSDHVRELVPFTNQPKRIEQGLGAIQRGDETALYDAILRASQELGQTGSDAGRRRVLVLITDGADSAKRVRYAQAIEQAQRAGAMIYSIIIVPIASDAGRDTGGEHALIQMSEDTGGKYYYVLDPKDLEPAFQHVSDDLRTQYLLGYYAPQRDADNSFRRIRVKLVEPAAAAQDTLRYRTGYYADTP